ncbi:glutamate ABC transporter substrate-binding protein [Streptomyces sp. NPDC051133]|uniref:glutamate ABC transporter substrate-binding protein n=1 Tax=Streptomyces sp. NPDC051133 TaxID=3155521 RepID=UPI003436F46D
MNVTGSVFRSVERRVAAAAALVAATALITSCSSSPSSAAKVPGTTASAGTNTGASKTIDQIIADEKPAAASLIPHGSTASTIKARGTLNVGGTQTAALFSLLDPTTGKIGGFDAALSQLLAKYIIGKPRTKLTNVTSATREALLKNHAVDAVFATYTITPERSKIVDFAGPYYMDGLALEVKKGNDSVHTLKDLKNKTVITESGSTAATIIKKEAPTAKILLFDTNTECLQALQQGRADAYILDQGILAGNASTNSDVKVLAATYSQEPYGIGLPPGDAGFKRLVNHWLQKIEADGTWAKVWKNTIGTQVPGPAPAPPKIG